ncbi:MAG: hypothetical protein AABY15_06855 [Nanoarchaeota archaeon]
MFDTLEKNTKAKTVNMRVVAIDETAHWRADIAKACGKIETVYMYDANQHTHCCELAPSYYLIPLYSIASNEISDEMDEELMNGHNTGSEPIYMHVSSVDKMKTQDAPFSHRLDGGIVYYASEGRKYRQIIEAAEEYFKGNHPI